MQHPIDPLHAGVLHVLAAPRIRARTGPHLDAGGVPDFAGLLEETETMSGGETLVVNAAADLWNATRNVGLVDVVHRLDTANFTRVLQGLRIARGSFTWETAAAIAAEGRTRDLAA